MLDTSILLSEMALSRKKSVPFLSKFLISNLNNSLVISFWISISIFLEYFSPTNDEIEDIIVDKILIKKIIIVKIQKKRKT